MAINASGQISLGGSTTGQSINLELGKLATATVSLNDTAVRTLAGIASGEISLSSFYGKSSEIAGKGYFGGGFTTAATSEIDGIEFATQTAVNPTITLSIARSNLAGVNSTIKGYYAGGNVSTVNYTEIDGILFSNETAINPSATLAVTRRRLSGVQSGGYL